MRFFHKSSPSCFSCFADAILGRDLVSGTTKTFLDSPKEALDLAMCPVHSFFFKVIKKSNIPGQGSLTIVSMSATTTTITEAFDLQHHELSLEERKLFLRAFNASQDRYPFTKWLKTRNGLIAGSIWFLGTSFLGLAAIGIYSYTTWTMLFNYMSVLVGFVYFTVKFGAHHMYAHSIFLQYEEWQPGGMSDQFKPIMFYAFYHHHSDKVDWCADLSIRKHSTFGVGDGLRGVLTSHWHGYSMWTEPWLIIFAGFLFLLNPWVTFSFFLGHEIGAYLLPTGHGWQHLSAKYFPYPLRKLYQSLEWIGVYANHKDHRKHHDHKHEFVYQSFTSSGLYSPVIDRYFDKVWNESFQQGTSKGLELIRRFYHEVTFGGLLMSIFGLVSMNHWML